jgi:hypothetical protein
VPIFQERGLKRGYPPGVGESPELKMLGFKCTTAATHEVVSECERLGFLNLPEIQVAPESVH